MINQNHSNVNQMNVLRVFLKKASLISIAKGVNYKQYLENKVSNKIKKIQLKRYYYFILIIYF